MVLILIVVVFKGDLKYLILLDSIRKIWLNFILKICYKDFDCEIIKLDIEKESCKLNKIL